MCVRARARRAYECLLPLLNFPQEMAEFNSSRARLHKLRNKKAEAAEKEEKELQRKAAEADFAEQARAPAPLPAACTRVFATLALAFLIISRSAVTQFPSSLSPQSRLRLRVRVRVCVSEALAMSACVCAIAARFRPQGPFRLWLRSQVSLC